MAYTVLARRYRSSTFDEVIGQEHITRPLKKAIESDRIAHAYLFCGTRGTGKTSTARILAKCLNCLSAKKATVTPCNKCDSCIAIARGDDIDVIEIDAASNTGVDNVRDIISNAQFRPARARYKVYIIDEVHMLSKSAFNALLKILEEPPEHVKFILATTEPEKVLPTILSRCQRYDFRNIPTREIAGHLNQVCKTEKIEADDDALMLVAKSGAGSMRDAISLLERMLSVGQQHLTAAGVEELLGLPRSQLLVDLTDAIGRGDVKETLGQLHAIINAGMSADTLLASLGDHLRNLLIINTCGMDSGLVEAPGLNPKDIEKQASEFDAVLLSQDITILEELRRQMRQSQTGRALMDATFVRLALAVQFTPLADVAARSTTAAPTAPAQKKKLDEPPAAVAEQVREIVDSLKLPPPAKPAEPMTVDAGDDDDDLPAPGKVWVNDSGGKSIADQVREATALVSAPKSVESDDVSRIWPQLLAQLNDAQGLSGVLLHARFGGIRDGMAIIRFDPSVATFVTRMANNGKRDLIARKLAELLGRPIGVKLEVDASAEAPTAATAVPSAPVRAARSTPAPPPEEGREAVVQISPEVRAQVENDPLVQAALQEFSGKIVRIE